MSDDGHLAFGSSEFFILKDKVAQCPQAVFGENVTGVDLTYVGEAYDQSLWQAIAAGAYAGEAKNKKVMIVVSPQWFFKGNGDQGKFASKFSYELYRRFANNPSISDETKAYVRWRVEALGVDAKTTAAANRDTVLDAANDAATAFADDLRTRSRLPGIIAGAPLKSTVRAAGASTGEPDWNALLKQADASGDAACTTNDFGIYDAYWQKNSGYHVERGQNFSQADEEYADLACFLRVCREAGLEPLVTILPVHGAWYDREGVAHAERQARLRAHPRAVRRRRGRLRRLLQLRIREVLPVRHGASRLARLGAHRAGVLRLRPRSRRRVSRRRPVRCGRGTGRGGKRGRFAGRRGRKRRWTAARGGSASRRRAREGWLPRRALRRRRARRCSARRPRWRWLRRRWRWGGSWSSRG